MKWLFTCTTHLSRVSSKIFRPDKRNSCKPSGAPDADAVGQDYYYYMKSLSRPARIPLLSLLGGAIGYMVLHPYTMLVYGLYREPGTADGPMGYGRLFHELVSSFHPGMLSMGIPFAVLGAAGGLFFGLWLETRRQRLETEKRLLAVETLRQIMMTISHHMLNAAQVIGGFAARDIRKEKDEDIRKHLEAIQNEAMRIEAVVSSLQSLESVKSDRFQGNSETAMVDIQEELREKMEELKRRQT